MNIWFGLAVLAAVVIYLSVPFAYFTGKRRARPLARSVVTPLRRTPAVPGGSTTDNVHK
jgi:hypothetical protein